MELVLQLINTWDQNFKNFEKMTVQEVVKKAIANGAQKVNAFRGAVRSDDLNTLEKGDKFTIPESYDILEQKIGNSDRTAQFIVVNVGGTPKNFYPSSLTKNLAIVDDACIPTGDRAKTKGEVCDWFKQQITVDAAMQKLKGCTLYIKDITPYQVKVYGSVADVQSSNFMTVEFDGDKRPE